MSDLRSAVQNSPSTGSYERKIVESQIDDTACSAPRSTGILRSLRRQERGGRSLPFGEQGQRSSVTVEKIPFANRPNLTVAEKARQFYRTQFFLNHSGVVIRKPEEAMATPVASAEATAVDRASRQALAQPIQQHGHVLGCASGVAALELHGLPLARHRADGQAARLQVAVQDVAHQKVAAVKILQILVHNQANE